ncbi:MAG: hypothetical protein KDJ65_23220 [Anaerolineae bacterium]|nr:hypothetical protein [Anaerolineae bacterium]
MDTPLLQTKLYIPATRSNLVTRPRLMERLNEGLPRKLTLIAAPAGFGKTSLVSDWVQQLDLPVAWLSLDEGDSELPHFLSYMVAALQKVDGDLGQTLLPLLQLSDPPPAETLMTLLINDIAALKQRLLLVFDDYHLIQTLAIHQALAFLLDRLPPQLHLVFISREDPPFPLARLRVRRQISEIRSRDLQFSLDEARQFLNQTMRLNLLPEAIATLERRTEGWVAGLQMAAIALQSYLTMGDQANPTDFVETFAGDDRYVVDYLIAEVLELQPPHILDFLQQTSLLKRFTAPLCEAVTGQANAQETLTYLEEANLFLVALDNRRQWYRYHHLFGDWLYHRLKQTSPQQLAPLHHRAGRWYQAQGFTDEAIAHALAGEAYEDAANLIEEIGLTMIGQARLSRLQQWITSLPEDVIAERPYLSVLPAWISALHRQADQTERHLRLAESAAKNLKENGPLNAAIACQIAMLWGYVCRLRYDLRASIRHIEQAIQFLPDDNAFLSCTAYLNLGGTYWGLGNFTAAEGPLTKALTFLDFSTTSYPALAASGFLTNSYLQRGQLREAGKVCRDVAQALPRHRRPPPAMAYLAIEQGALLYEQNDLMAAEETLSQAVQLGENLDRIVNVGRALLILARIKQVTGHDDDTAALLERAATKRPPTAAEFDHCQVRLWLAQKNDKAAGRWAEAYEAQRGEERPWHILNELTLAHVLLADNRPERAIEIVSRCEAMAQAAEITGWVIRSLIFKAVCYQTVSHIEQALRSLQQALALAEPADYCRTFIDYGLPMQQLLQQVTAQGIAPAYVARLLAAFPDQTQALPVVNPTPNSQPLIEPLNDREQSILRLMAAGLSNREIADQLYLSVNTIKWHSSNIYGKLGVKKRAEAVDRAHEMGIM